MRNRIITLKILFTISCSLMPLKSEASRLHQEDGIMTNHSAEYVRTLNRNTSTDADAAFYNPAGLAFIKGTGLIISFTSQTYHVEKTHTMDFYALEKDGATVTPPHKQTWFRDCLPDEYKAVLTAPVLPGVDIIWKEDKWAAFFDIAVMQAALDMTFPQGLAVMDWGNLLGQELTLPSDTHLIQYTRNALAVRNEMYIGLTAGGAYEFANWLSAGGGLRIIHANGNMSIKMTNINFLLQDEAGTTYGVSDGEDWDISTDTSGIGYGLILSTHFRAEGLVDFLKNLEGSFRLEYYAPMELAKKTNSFVAPWKIEGSGNLDIFKDGSANPAFNDGAGYAHGNGDKTLKVTYPTTLNFGLSYLFLEWIKFSTSAQVSLRSMRDLDGREKDYTNGYQLGGGIEFLITPEVTLSTGYLYNDFGIKPDKRSEADPLLSSHIIGRGAGFNVNDNLVINTGIFFQFYTPATVYEKNHVSSFGNESVSYIRKDLDEKRFSVAIGFTYRLSGIETDGEKVKEKEKGKENKSGKAEKTAKPRKAKGKQPV